MHELRCIYIKILRLILAKLSYYGFFWLIYMIFYTEFENYLPWLHALNFFCPRICIHYRINKRDHGKFTLSFSSRTNQGLLMYLKKKNKNRNT